MSVVYLIVIEMLWIEIWTVFLRTISSVLI